MQAVGNACAASGDLSAALAAWTQAIGLVPPSSTKALAVLHEQSAQVRSVQGLRQHAATFAYPHV